MAIIDARGGAGLAQLSDTLLKIMVNKQQSEMAAENLKIRKGEFQLKQDEFKAKQEEEALAKQQAASQFNRLFQSVTRGGPGAAQAMQVLEQTGALGVAQGGDARVIQETQQTLGRPQGTRPSQIEVTQEQVRNQALLDEIGKQASSLALAAEASQAGITTAVTDELVTPGKGEAALTSVELRNEMQSLLNSRDPRIQPALNALITSRGALSWGEIKSAIGIVSEDNIPDDFRMPKPTEPINSARVKAQTFVPLMKEAHGNINRLSDSGVRMSLPSTFIQGSKNASIRGLIGSFQDPNQLALVQAQSAFGDFYRFSLSGQQSGEAERIAMLFSITEQFGDGELVIGQKRRLRNVMIATQEIVANGGMTPLEAAQQALKVVMEQGNDDFTAAFQDEIDKILKGGPSNVPGGGEMTNEELRELAASGGNIFP